MMNLISALDITAEDVLEQLASIAPDATMLAIQRAKSVANERAETLDSLMNSVVSSSSKKLVAMRVLMHITGKTMPEAREYVEALTAKRDTLATSE